MVVAGLHLDVWAVGDAAVDGGHGGVKLGVHAQELGLLDAWVKDKKENLKGRKEGLVYTLETNQKQLDLSK